MKKILTILAIILLTTVFIYFMNVISDNNKCSWVRVFDC